MAVTEGFKKNNNSNNNNNPGRGGTGGSSKGRGGTGGSGKVKSCKDEDGAQGWELSRPTTYNKVPQSVSRGNAYAGPLQQQMPQGSGASLSVQAQVGRPTVTTPTEA